LGRVFLAFRCFFAILFRGRLSPEAIERLGLMPRTAQPSAPAAPPRPAAPAADHIDGAVQMLSILQRDSRLIDFLMEDISAYDDEQIGAAVRSLHDQCRDSLGHYVHLAPVIDGVEGTLTHIAGTPAAADPSFVKFVGNVPAEPPKSGVLRHKGWRAEKVELPVPPHRSPVVAPAEIEIE
jgi:hypothetical protein